MSDRADAVQGALWTKGILQWKWHRTLYLSVVFTWDLPQARHLAKQHNGTVRAGGPAVELLPEYLADVADVETPLEIPALGLHNPFACRTSVGCPRHCEFCINRDKPLELLPEFEPRPLVCDDNFLACGWAHIERAVEKLARLPFVDFNQGLDARLFTADVAELFVNLPHVRLRFAWDAPGQEEPVRRAIEIAKDAGLHDQRCYVLIGYPAKYDTPEFCRYRCEALQAMGVGKPNVMRFQPVRGDERHGIEASHLSKKNSYVSPYWTAAELRRQMRYWNRQAWLGGVRLEDFQPAEPEPLWRHE